MKKTMTPAAIMKRIKTIEQKKESILVMRRLPAHTSRSVMSNLKSALTTLRERESP